MSTNDFSEGIDCVISEKKVTQDKIDHGHTRFVFLLTAADRVSLFLWMLIRFSTLFDCRSPKEIRPKTAESRLERIPQISASSNLLRSPHGRPELLSYAAAKETFGGGVAVSLDDDVIAPTGKITSAHVQRLKTAIEKNKGGSNFGNILDLTFKLVFA